MSLPVTIPPKYRIDTLSLSLDVRERPILSDVTCTAHPSEVLSIVGPSGAGKTSLLSILAGSVSSFGTLTGQILLNAAPLTSFSKLRRLSAYVTQEETLFPLLTVRESLSFSARLRNPNNPNPDAILKELSLDHVAESRIGSLSGGERRRVSIGSELVHDPQILLLDEPTSGLDSASALHVITLLKSMAVLHGKTIILTIHQPGFRILDLLDRVVLISNGSVKHYGTLSLLEKKLIESGQSIPQHVNVLEFAMDAIELSLCTTEMSGINVSNLQDFSKIVPEKDQIHYANSPLVEIGILTARFFKNVSRTKQLSSARMLQCVVAGFGLGTIFINLYDIQSRVGFFAFSLTFLLSSTTEGLPIYLEERKILTKETSRGAYRISSYVIANTLVFLPFLLMASLLYSTPVYFLVGLRRQIDGFLYFLMIVWMVMMMANSFVACFSALVPNFIMGNSLIAGCMGSFFLFSGYFIAKNNIPKYWMFMYYLSLFRYPFEGFLINEYGGERGRRECVHRVGGECVFDGEMFLRQQGLVEYEKWSSLGVIVGFICWYRVLCFVILWVRCYKLRR